MPPLLVALLLALPAPSPQVVVPSRPVVGVVPSRPVVGVVPSRPVVGVVPPRPVAGVVPARPIAVVVPARPGAAGSLAPLAGPQRYGWPVAPPRVVRRFDPPARPWLAGHRGVDLASAPSAMVRAAGAGRVVFVGAVAGRGVVSITHHGGLRTTYEPVAATVAVGDQVATGDPVGALEPGHPGCPAAACLHWGLRRGGLYLDPLALLGLGRVRLLPLDDSA